jgi:hypothetical protein
MLFLERVLYSFYIARCMYTCTYIINTYSTDDDGDDMYMESMDGEKKEKIRIQGHKIKSLSHSLVPSLSPTTTTTSTTIIISSTCMISICVP